MPFVRAREGHGAGRLRRHPSNSGATAHARHDGQAAAVPGGSGAAPGDHRRPERPRGSRRHPRGRLCLCAGHFATWNGTAMKALTTSGFVIAPILCVGFTYVPQFLVPLWVIAISIALLRQPPQVSTGTTGGRILASPRRPATPPIGLARAIPLPDTPWLNPLVAPVPLHPPVVPRTSASAADRPAAFDQDRSSEAQPTRRVASSRAWRTHSEREVPAASAARRTDASSSREMRTRSRGDSPASDRDGRPRRRTW